MQAIQPSENQQQQQSGQQGDIFSLPLPIRIKHPSWSARKGTYQQLLYYLKTIQSPQEEILISGNAYTVETLLPYFENLIHEKHAGVLLKGLECVEQILTLDKKAYAKHCIRSLVDKGIQFFPLLSQQRKAILEKFLDILELSKIEPSFLKNKLNLPHEKSVMYVIEVIGVLNMTSLNSVLNNLSKKHQKKCVRQMAAEIAQQLQQAINVSASEPANQIQTNKPTSKPINNTSTKPKPGNLTCKYTIEKLPHYEQLPSKKQQQFSTELAQKIDAIIEEYTFAQLPNFSHILRLMIDDNNHIINVNAIKCLIAIFNKEKDDGLIKTSLVPASFPLLFLFNKFKSHKTHPINTLMLSLVQSILQSSSNRVNDIFQAISEGLSSGGSKANVKFGCGLSFFRIVSLLYRNEDLHKCTVNENMESENEDLMEKAERFEGVKLGKNLMKVVEKIMSSLDKEKKYETEMYLIKYAIGLDTGSMGGIIGNGSTKQLLPKNSKTIKSGQQNQSQSKNRMPEASRHKKDQENEKMSKKAQSAQFNTYTHSEKDKPLVSKGLEAKLAKTLKQGPKFQQINLQQTLNKILKLVNSQNDKLKSTIAKQMKPLLERSEQQFWQCVKEKRFEMFYLCELLEHFIQNYQPHDSTIEKVSEYLISLLKIVSMLKPLTNVTQIGLSNVSQLLLVALCKLVISEEIAQVLENVCQSYGFQVIFEALEELFVKRQQKMKKKNKKQLLQWLECNTPALYLNKDYYRLADAISEKGPSKNLPNSHTQTNNPNDPPIKSNQQQNQQATKGNKTNKQITKQTLLELSPKKTHRSKLLTIDQWSSGKKQHFSNQLNELQNINLSKIQKNVTESNEYYDDDMQKSSFHQNIEQHLKQIRTNRSYEDCEEINRNVQHNTSREYLRHLQNRQVEEKEVKENQFRKKYPETYNEEYQRKNMQNMQILESSPFKNDQSHDVQEQEPQYQPFQHQGHKIQMAQEQNYEQKCNQVDRRRAERQRQRRDFINRMKHQFQPIIHKNEQSNNSGDNFSQEDSQYQDNDRQTGKFQQEQRSIVKEKSRLRDYDDEGQEDSVKNDQIQEQSQYDREAFTKLSPTRNYVTGNDDPSGQLQTAKETYSSIPSPSTSQSIPHSQVSKDQPDCSFISSTSTGEFKYRQLNQEKLSYMLKSTTNPYQHLRNLILIPFKSSNKKHHFLKELLHFLTNHVQFNLPQPYTSLILLVILMFSQIKQDKTLIQPLQSLYEFLAKQSTTNDFIKTIVSLFHTVIEETLPQNRKFLITILLKSMIRMLPFIQDGLSLLRDIQQFYQIGQMVYFQMFEDEYTQIQTYMQDEAVHIVVEKAYEQEGQNLRSIVEGWLGTQWKNTVIQILQEFENDHSDPHEGEQAQNNDENQQNYQSYI